MNINKKIKVLSTKVVSNFWAKLEQINFDFTFNNGRTANLTHEVYGKNDGVAILLYNKETKTVILTKQFRLPMYVAGVNNGFSYEVCGGAIDKNETPQESVIRETKEEIGYKVLNLQEVTTLFLSPGLMKEQVHLFVGAYDENSKVEGGGGLEEENEEIEVLEVSVEEAFSFVKRKLIVDARTILLLQHIRLKFGC